MFLLLWSISRIHFSDIVFGKFLEYMSDIVTQKSTFAEPICNYCKHWFKGTLSCNAFAKIPMEILSGKEAHSNRHASQKNDVVFEPVDEISRVEKVR